MKKKLYFRTFTGIAVIAVLLFTAASALAATQNFSLSGVLELDGTQYSVGGVNFDLDVSTTCDDDASGPNPPVLCSTVDLTPWLGTHVTVAGTFDPDVLPVVRTANTIVKVTDPAAVFTYKGELTGTGASWFIDGKEFKFATGLVLPEFFALGDTVRATYTLVGTTKEASEFVVTDSAGSYTYPGELTAINGDIWTVGAHDFTVGVAAQPPFFAVGDMVEVTFDIVGGDKIASAVTVTASGEDNTYVLEGVLKEGSDNTVWLIGDYSFDVSGVALPPYFAPGDTVEVTFKIVDGKFVVVSVRVTQTVVPNKVESSRCENRLKEHPAIVKLAAEVGEANPDVILALFCKGFGVGEIKLAYKYAEGSQYTPRMLLALRASGLGWGEIKKMAAGLSVDEEPEEPGEGEETDVKIKGKPETTGKPEHTGKPENTGKPDKSEKDNPGKGKGKDK